MQPILERTRLSSGFYYQRTRSGLCGPVVFSGTFQFCNLGEIEGTKIYINFVTHCTQKYQIMISILSFLKTIQNIQQQSAAGKMKQRKTLMLNNCRSLAKSSSQIMAPIYAPMKCSTAAIACNCNVVSERLTYSPSPQTHVSSFRGGCGGGGGGGGLGRYPPNLAAGVR